MGDGGGEVGRAMESIGTNRKRGVLRWLKGQKALRCVRTITQLFALPLLLSALRRRER